MRLRRALAAIGGLACAALANGACLLAGAAWAGGSALGPADAAAALAFMALLSLPAVAVAGVPVLALLGAFRALRWWSCALCAMAMSVAVGRALFHGGSLLDGGGLATAASGMCAGLAFWAAWRLGAPASEREPFWGPRQAPSWERWAGAAAALAMGAALWALAP